MDLQTKIRLNGDISEQSSSEQSQQPADLCQENHSMDHSISGLPRNIPFHVLKEITDGFSKERTLGSGAFGKVYMGVHKNGEKIAVKMLYDTPGLEKEQFLNEFSNLARLQHRNIVRLVGYCHEIQKECVEHNGKLVVAERIRKALCFEYMNGSLDKHLSDEYHGLDWNTRYKLIKGICNGLKYLHEELNSPLYHLDLKPANILLDENMLPKIADFGLSRFFGEERTQITKSFKGTLGYIPPEYIERNIISNKFDIFSLGVVIIKIITGPTGYSRSAEMSHQEFIDLVHENWRNRLQATLMDLFESHLKLVKRCMEIALSSVEVNRHKRPSIGDIIIKLNETETTILRWFKKRLRNDPGSSMDQVSTSRYPVDLKRMGISVEPFQVPQLAFSWARSQQGLQAVLEGSIHEAWTFIIFWKSSVDAVTGSSCLSWGDGYYKGCEEDEKGPSKRQPTTPAVQAEQEYRKRIFRDLLSLVDDQNATSAVTPASWKEEVSDELWSNLMSVMQSFVDSSGVRGQDQEQQHRKHVLRELNSLLSGCFAACDRSKDPDMEDVTDTEWFFLVSMTKSYPAGSVLLGNPLLASRSIWITTALSNVPCERAREAYTFGLRTMVCIPIGTGVLELGSTNFIFKTTESIPRILSLFNQGMTELVD